MLIYHHIRDSTWPYTVDLRAWSFHCGSFWWLGHDLLISWKLHSCTVCEVKDSCWSSEITSFLSYLAS